MVSKFSNKYFGVSKDDDFDLTKDYQPLPRGHQFNTRFKCKKKYKSSRRVSAEDKEIAAKVKQAKNKLGFTI